MTNFWWGVLIYCLVTMVVGLLIAWYIGGDK